MTKVHLCCMLGSAGEPDLWIPYVATQHSTQASAALNVRRCWCISAKAKTAPLILVHTILTLARGHHCRLSRAHDTFVKICVDDFQLDRCRHLLILQF